MTASLQILTGDCRAVLPTLADGSVQCCVTSPPYWGLRDYGHPEQIGQEATPKEFVATMVAVFREVRRVLRDDGTLWLNLGDSYNGYMANQRGTGLETDRQQSRKYVEPGFGLRDKTLKSKDLVGIPWMVAFALRADGWWLRQDIIWAKPNPMPESVTDRCTKSHEYLFLLTKSAKYFYDAEAISEPVSVSMMEQVEQGYDGLGLKDYEAAGVQNPSSVKARIIANARKKAEGKPATNGKHAATDENASGRRMVDNVARARAEGGAHDAPFGLARNKRSVWTVATKPYKGSHFATFPPELITPCVLAGTRPGDTVLDPFAGSGTTGQVSLENGREAILIELNPEYVGLIKKRTDVTPGFQF